MPRLTLDLIQRSKQELNPNKDRQLTLRGNKIEVIENLGASQDHFTCIDLSENGIMKLSGMPILSRLKTLMLANNCIKRVEQNVAHGCPNIVSLVLTNNKLSMLCDVNPLGKMKNLERLTLLGNPITKLPNYRLYVIWAMRETKLRVLDFARILDVERKKADKMFSGPEGAELLQKVAPKRISAEEAEKEKMDTLDTSAVERIKEAITNATTLEEVTRLEKALKDGKLSAGDLEELLKPKAVREKEEKEREEKEKKEEEDEERLKAEKEKGGISSSSSPASSPQSAAALKPGAPKADTNEDVEMTPKEDVASPKARTKSASRSRSRNSSLSRKSRSSSRSDKKSRKSSASRSRSRSRSDKKRKKSEEKKNKNKKEEKDNIDSESEEKKKRKVKEQQGSDSESEARSAKKKKGDD